MGDKASLATSAPVRPLRIGRRRIAYAALLLSLFAVPWDCGRLWVPAFTWAGGSEISGDRFAFVIGRIVLLAPSLLATALALLALADRHGRAHRDVAHTALVFSLVWLFLVNLGVHFHAGD